jgi:large exoprotein involved in heme utilization and adhesion
MSTNSTVTTAAEQAEGGNIQLTVGSLVELRDGQMTATVKGGAGKGGNITINAQSVVLQRSQVRADAFGGPGGNITITAEAFLADPASQVSASSALAAPGEVNIQALTDVSGLVAPLPQSFGQATTLLATRCAERRRAGKVSTLVLGRRDGLPREPGMMWPSPLASAAPRGQAEGDGPPAPRAAAVGGLGVNVPGAPPFKERAVQSGAAAMDLECAKSREAPRMR